MLRRITVEELQLGMYVQAMEGSWLQHPFWRRSFLLDSPADLAKLRASALPGVVIDDARGITPATPETAPVAATAPPKPAPLRRAPSRSRPLEAPTSVAEEIKRARKTVQRSKRAVMRLFGEARLGKAIDATSVTPLVDEIAASVARNPSALIGIVRLKTRDEYTYLHSVAVCALMINLARHLEWDEAAVQEAGLAGMLHDVGKMAIPEAVLAKPGRLTDEEFALIRGHPERGHDILAASEGVSAAALDVCLHHHEKIDGSGYPFGLAGDRISAIARMGAICDVYDAVTSNRPYKDPWEPADSLARMLDWRGHFDADLMAAFVRSIGIYPIGMLVRLRSNRLGVVAGDNPADPTRPLVRAFYSIMERAMIAPEDVIVAHDLRGDQIVGRERPERWGLEDWEAMRAELLGRS